MDLGLTLEVERFQAKRRCSA